MKFYLNNSKKLYENIKCKFHLNILFWNIIKQILFAMKWKNNSITVLKYLACNSI